MDKILIDTDVLLDFFFDRLPFSNHAAQLLNLCKEKRIVGFTSPVIISNTYYMLRKTAQHSYCVDKLNQLMNILDIVEMDKKVIIQALNSNFKDFEDALQNFSAIRSKNISVIVTRNLKHYKKSPLAIMTPESYLKSRITLS